MQELDDYLWVNKVQMTNAKELTAQEKKDVIAAILAGVEAKERKYVNLIPLDKMIHDAKLKPGEDEQFFPYLQKQMSNKSISDLRTLSKDPDLLKFGHKIKAAVQKLGLQISNVKSF